MRLKFLLILLVFLFPAPIYAAVDLPWSTTFDCAEWEYPAALVCDGWVEAGGWGTCIPTKYSQITSAANMAVGNGGRGQRHYTNSGTNQNSGGLKINISSAQSELWVRWYMRYESGYSWDHINYDKIMRFDQGSDHYVIPEFYGWDDVDLYTVIGGRHNGGIGWTTIMGGATGDGLWHYYEVHLKMDTNGSNGIAQFWVDGVLQIDLSNLDHGTGSGWSSLNFGDNQEQPDGGCKVVDFDDIAINNTGYIGSLSGTAALTGTIVTGGVTEAEIVAGGETLIITLIGDTWVATVGADNAITTALITGLDSGGSEAAGWDAEVKGDGTNKMTHAEVVRTNDTVVTITLTAKAAYAITTNETITATIPATALTGAVQVVASPTFEITASNPVCTMAGTLSDGATEAQIVTGSETLIGTVSDTELVATFGADNAITTAFIALIDSAQSEAGGWDAQVKANIDHTMISRDSATQWTLTTPAAAGFDISANETITVKLPTTATTSGVEITCTSQFNLVFFNPSGEECVGITMQ